MMFHSISDRCVGFTNVLFSTDGTFKQVDGMGRVARVNVWYLEILLNVTGEVALTSKLFTSSTLCMSTGDVLR